MYWDGSQLGTTGMWVQGALSVGTAGHFKCGATAYNTGTGWWMEYNAGTPRIFIGNAAGNKLLWTGSALELTGTVTATAGVIGGFTLASTYLQGGDLKLDAGNGRLYLGTGYLSWTGAGTWWTLNSANLTVPGSVVLNGTFTFSLGAMTGATGTVNVATVECDDFRIAHAVGTAALTCDKFLVINMNGTNYRIPCVAGTW